MLNLFKIIKKYKEFKSYLSDEKKFKFEKEKENWRKEIVATKELDSLEIRKLKLTDEIANLELKKIVKMSEIECAYDKKLSDTERDLIKEREGKENMKYAFDGIKEVAGKVNIIK